MPDKMKTGREKAKRAAYIKALTKKNASHRETHSSVSSHDNIHTQQARNINSVKDRENYTQTGRSEIKHPAVKLFLPNIMSILRRRNNNVSDSEETATDKLEKAGLDVADAIVRMMPATHTSKRKNTSHRETYFPEHSDETSLSKNRASTKEQDFKNYQSKDAVHVQEKNRPEIKERCSHSSGAIKTKEEVGRKAQLTYSTETVRTDAAKILAVDEARRQAVTKKVKAVRLKAALKRAAKSSSDMLLYAGAGFIALLLPLLIVMAIGGMMYGSDEHSVGTEELSEEVHEHSPYIFAYACEYELEEYVSLIKAVMMQESGGRGDDPMQASECNYNTKYPKSPNGITDPEYSIDVGIQYLKECLELAGVKDPDDIECISLALQGYNFGTGYISWARAKYGGYSQLSAMEFSEYMAEQMGWESYGDPYYVSHVLRYYSAGEG